MMQSIHPMTITDNDNDDDGFVTANDWFASGKRVHYDPLRKRIVPDDATTGNKTSIQVFERVVTPTHPAPNTRWLTLLPGFPEGSYGYAQVDSYLDRSKLIAMTSTSRRPPRLYVDYIGQGDSDVLPPLKSKKGSTEYDPYSTFARADLVEALWHYHDIRNTVLVAFDFSSLVILELLQRQKERHSRGVLFPRIEHVLVVNGGLFADGHSHPLLTTPLLKCPTIGQAQASCAQRSDFVYNKMIRPFHGKNVRSALSKKRRQEMASAIRRHNGAKFLSLASGFVAEHKQNAKRWDLYDIYINFCLRQGITFHIIGSDDDPFEHRQMDLVRSRLGDYSPNVRVQFIPGGHMALNEQAVEIGDCIAQLGLKPSTERANITIVAKWTTLATTSPAIDQSLWSFESVQPNAGKQELFEIPIAPVSGPSWSTFASY